MDATSSPFLKDTAFQETAPYEKGFAAHFDANIRPFLAGMEQSRLTANEEIKRRTIIFIVVAVVAITILYLLGVQDAILYVIPLGIGLFWVADPSFKYKQQRRETLLPRIISFYPGFTYEAKSKIPLYVLEASRLVRGIKKSSFTANAYDLITGAHEGIDLSIAYLLAQTKNGKDTDTVFQGLFITLEMRKPFQGVTVVKNQTLDTLQSKTGNNEARVGLERVELEGSEFERLFEVYSSDQIEARYLLTPDIMERLLKLSELLGKNMVECSFVNQQLYISIPFYRRLFVDGTMDTPAHATDDIHTFLQGLNMIFEITDILKLRQRIEVNAPKA